VSIIREEWVGGEVERRQMICLAFAALTILGLALRLLCMTGLIGSDDLEYARYAQAMLDGTYAQTMAESRGVRFIHWALRYGVLLPLAATYRVFGVSEWSTIVLPLTASTASVLLLAQIGRQLFNWRIGMIAGLLYATFPLQLRYATILSPEPIAECFVLIGVLLYLRGEKAAAPGNHEGTGTILWYGAAGVVLGLAYLAKESALFIAAAFVLQLLWERRWREALLVGGGLVSVVVVEHAYYVLVHGDILFRPHAVVLHASDDPETSGSVNLMRRWFWVYPRRMLLPTVSFGVHSVVCVGLAAAALTLRPRRRYAMLLLWAVVPLFYLNFGSSSLTSYIVMPTQPRYLELIYPPIILLSSVFISRALAMRKAVAIAVTIVVAITCVVGVRTGLATRGRGWRTDEVAVLRAIVQRLDDETPERKIYTADSRWHDTLAILDRSRLSPSASGAALVLVADPLGLPSLEPIETPATQQSPVGDER
jgi:4-amino-4-deoxy-L-arabinose transferase-like glycosyltransferase